MGTHLVILLFILIATNCQSQSAIGLEQKEALETHAAGFITHSKKVFGPEISSTKVSFVKYGDSKYDKEADVIIISYTELHDNVQSIYGSDLFTADSLSSEVHLVAFAGLFCHEMGHVISYKNQLLTDSLRQAVDITLYDENLADLLSGFLSLKTIWNSSLVAIEKKCTSSKDDIGKFVEQILMNKLDSARHTLNCIEQFLDAYKIAEVWKKRDVSSTHGTGIDRKSFFDSGVYLSLVDGIVRDVFDDTTAFKALVKHLNPYIKLKFPELYKQSYNDEELKLIKRYLLPAIKPTFVKNLISYLVEEKGIEGLSITLKKYGTEDIIKVYHELITQKASR